MCNMRTAVAVAVAVTAVVVLHSLSQRRVASLLSAMRARILSSS